jgi:hypothetical protein
VKAEKGFLCFTQKFFFLRLAPQFFHFLQRRFVDVFALGGEGGFNMAKAAFKFLVRAAQSAFGIDIQLAGEVDDNEQNVASSSSIESGFFPDLISASSSAISSWIFPRTSMDFPNQSPREPPVAEISKRGRGREGRCSPYQNAWRPLLVFRLRRPFLGLVGFPVRQNVLRGRGVSRPENVRMAFDHLFRFKPRHIVEREGAVFIADLSVKNDLEEEVAQFLDHVGCIARLDGLHDLIGFLQRIAGEACVVLLKVPRTAAFAGAQAAHHVQKGENSIRGKRGLGGHFSAFLSMILIGFRLIKKREQEMMQRVPSEARSTVAIRGR